MSLRDPIPENIKKLRELRGITQLELAQKAGISRRTLARLENGDVRDPGIKQLRTLASALGVTLDLLASERLTVVRIAVPERMRERFEGPFAAEIVTELSRRRGP